jgi:hypothetical protein
VAVRLVIAVTDGDWFNHLRTKPELPEVNFWAPGAAPFKALQPGELFLFKLHTPLNYIVGGGVFAYANTIPCSLPWEAFREGNGAASLAAVSSASTISGNRPDRAAVEPLNRTRAMPRVQCGMERACPAYRFWDRSCSLQSYLGTETSHRC